VLFTKGFISPVNNLEGEKTGGRLHLKTHFLGGGGPKWTPGSLDPFKMITLHTKIVLLI